MNKSTDTLKGANLQSAVRTVLRRCRPITAFTSINTFLLGSMVAYAQSATGPVASQAPMPKLEEVVVTAQRRKQTVQDVPYNISVIDPKQIDESGATTLERSHPSRSRPGHRRYGTGFPRSARTT